MKTKIELKQNDKEKQVFSRAKDNRTLLTGNPVKEVLLFSLPLVLGNIFVQFYSITDAAIVGNYIGINAFAAIGSTSWIVWILIALCRDASNAVCTLASYKVGENAAASLKKITIYAFSQNLMLIILFSILLLLFLDPILALLQVDKLIYDQARTYLFIYILSTPFLMLNNTACAILRAKGNSLFPSAAMFLSTISNIILDLAFVCLFHMGVAGAAWATFIAQVISAVIAFYGLYMIRSNRTTTPSSEESFYSFSRRSFGLFFPMFGNSLMITAGGLFVQARINALGAGFTAGTTAGIKVFDVLEAIIMAIMSGLSVFVGQNMGARQFGFMKKGISQLVTFGIGLILMMISIVWLFEPPIISFFLKGESGSILEEAFSVAFTHIRCLCIGMIIMTPMYFLRAAIQTMGYPIYPFIAGCFQLAARIFSVSLLPQLIGITAYYLTDVLAWMVSLPIIAVAYIAIIRRFPEADSAGQKRLS